MTEEEEGSELRASLEGTGVTVAAEEPELLAAMETARASRSSWRFFMIAGLVVLLVECLLADRLLQKQRSRRETTAPLANREALQDA